MSKAEAAVYAQRRKALTGKEQVVYKSQEGHFLWCSREAWDKGQAHISGRANAVEVI